MSSALDFVLLDVFSDRVFGGNQLAVFPSADALEADAMAAIARELKTNETTFVTGREPCGFTFRIFSPHGELPFAGHPTVGTAAVLAAASHGLVSGEDQRLEFILRAPAGPIRIEVSGQEKDRQIMLQSPTLPQRIEQCLDRSALAVMLGLVEAELTEDEEAQAFSSGIPFFCIPLKDRSALRKAKLDKRLWNDLMGSAPAPHCYLFARGDDERTIHARMFAPAVGIDEDPATGAAAIALGGFLAQQRSEGECQLKFDIYQGAEMGRQSRIRLEVHITDGKPNAVYIGGQCALFARCRLDISEAVASDMFKAS